jgi:hypothetical protein
MDDFRITIKEFFNRKWLTSSKVKRSLTLSENIIKLIEEYNRIYGTRMSQSQIVEFLISQRLNEVKHLPDYEGIYLRSNTSKLKTEFRLIKDGSKL